MLSHRFELNQQAIKSFEFICREEVDFEQGEFMADQRSNKCRIVVASVQSLNSRRKGQKRMERFDPNEFGLLMIDEAHRSAAVSYQSVIRHFQKNPNLKVVGVTATPDRHDKVGLGAIYDDIACDYNILWGISNGWLVEPVQKFVQIDGLDLSTVRSVGSGQKRDFDQNKLAELVEAEKTLHEMAGPIVDVAGPENQAIVFTASVAQAKRLCEMIRDYYVRKFDIECEARSIDGSMTPQDPRRQAIVRDFKEGAIQFLVNCGVATEGFDAPNVKLIAIARPTRSRALYIQMLGRGTRPLPGLIDGLNSAEERRAAIAGSDKPNCTILDFVGQAKDHKLVCSATDILAGEELPEVVERAKEMQTNPDFDRSALDALQEAREQLEKEAEAARVKPTADVDYQLLSQGSVHDISDIRIRMPNYLPQNVRAVSDKQRQFMLALGYREHQIDQIRNKAEASAAIERAIWYPMNNLGKKMRTKKLNAGEACPPECKPSKRLEG